MSKAGRFLIGPVLTLGVAIAITLVEHAGHPVAFPVAVGFLPVAIAFYFSGPLSGFLSAAIGLVNAVVLFPPSGGLFEPRPASEGRAILLMLTAFVVGLMIIREKKITIGVQNAQLAKEAASSHLITLRAALDQVEYGVVLLDRDYRARFINAAYRKSWRLPDEIADANPTFIELLRYSADIGAYAAPPPDRDEYIASRIQLVRAGDAMPLDLDLADGTILRFQCVVLPEGGRMLSYTNVTDLYRHSQELERLAATDGLTGLLNRRSFLELLAREWDQAEREGTPLSLLMIDIDTFKLINDHYGHDAGDQVLAAVADVCRSEIRAGDTAARLGGEEFAVLLPDTDAVSGFKIADRLRWAIGEIKISSEQSVLTTTVSIGIAQKANAVTTPASLLKAADIALYEAKAMGRNRVIPDRRELYTSAA